jgi:hypothetical protein
MSTISPKKVAEKVQRVTTSWQTLRPAKTYAGMTLAQYQAKVQPTLDAHSQVQTLSDQLKQTRDTRRLSNTTSMATTKLVVNAIKGDPDDGEDSPFYAALGYVQSSSRKSGLTRKKSQTTTTPQTTAATVAAPTATASPAVPTTTVK